MLLVLLLGGPVFGNTGLRGTRDLGRGRLISLFMNHERCLVEHRLNAIAY
jgi:hypothetical protein